MYKQEICIIAALERTTRAIGKDNHLLWKIPADMKRFRELTMGNAVIMGRKTYESIGYPLQGRSNIVVSRSNPKLSVGVYDVGSVGVAFELTRMLGKAKAFVIGGEKIFEEALSRAQVLYLTLIDDPKVQADRFFPDYSAFTEIIYEEKLDQHVPPFRFVDLKKPAT